MTKLFFSEPISTAENLLRTIYNSTDKISEINRISASDFLKIRALVISQAEKILHASTTDSKALDEALILFIASIDRLWRFASKVPAVTFSCQLLQYDTVLFHKEMPHTAGVKNFLEFLEHNAGEFGAWADNLLLMEYVLLKINHELAQFPDALLPKKLQTKNNFILGKLNNFSNNIAQWKLDAPDNTFVHYLDCIYSFIKAKALDFQATKSAPLTEQESTFFIESKQYFSTKAVTCLHTINDLTEDAALRGMLTPAGMEFSLGLNVLVKPPIQEIRSTEKNTRMMSCS